MFLIDIAGLKILYTGDYSREEGGHLVKAEVPRIRPDVLIIESTHGVQNFEAGPAKEAVFISDVHAIIKRGGHYWDQHPELHNVPTYHTSSLAQKCMSAYHNYVHVMNENTKDWLKKTQNPFVFKHISSLPHGPHRKEVAEGGPCVVLVSPALLDVRISRGLLKTCAPDSRNGLIITWYSIGGSMALHIATKSDEIIGVKGNTIPRRMSFSSFSFSTHVNYSQNAQFIDLIGAKHIILVHGERTVMGLLRDAPQSKYKEIDESVKSYTPKNLETLNPTIHGDRIGKVRPSALAAEPPPLNTIISGLLVAKDSACTLLDPKDLEEFTGLLTSSRIQKVRTVIGCSWNLVRWHMEGMHRAIDKGRDKGGILAMRIMNPVDVKWTSETEVTLEWTASASNDMVADSVFAVLMSIDRSPASVKSHDNPPPFPHIHADETKRHEVAPVILHVERIIMFLEAHFGVVELRYSEEEEPTVESEKDDESLMIVVTLDDNTTEIGLLNMASFSPYHFAT
ncbi:endoribonuclease ysh1 [Tulasnella sp. 330]|nr:endoribonuclease ysh1 [Tulasnella sp. 330]